MSGSSPSDPELSRLRGRTVVLCVTGSVAAYKAVEVARRLLAAGARVVPAMTASGARFVGPVTLSGICGEKVATDMWDPSFAGEMHVAIAARADVVAIVPATADTLARLAQGRADDLVCAIALCARGPVVAAPAMHPRMWSHPATRANVDALSAQGRVALIGPVDGPVASGESGLGRMADPDTIVRGIADAVGPRDLAGRRVVVTAGPTLEDLDPVRFLGNRSTGKMGFAIAARAASRGAEVTLVSGPVELATPAGVRRVDVRSALEMRDALRAALGDRLENADALVMSAAVADYRPAATSPGKIKKEGESSSIALVRNPDLLAEIGALRAERSRPLLVGFAVETGTDADVERYAKDKLARKKVDLVVANAARDSFGRDDNRAALVGADGATWLARQAKSELADAILDAVRARLDHADAEARG